LRLGIEVVGRSGVGEGRMFFFEKKNQKTFATGDRSLIQAPVTDSDLK
jgi:hypothetical protein